VEYKIITESDHKEFSRSITEHLIDGWELHGELLVTPFSHEDVDIPDYCFYTQAMTRQEVSPDTENEFMDELKNA
jgi:hypothetical protein